MQTLLWTATATAALWAAVASAGPAANAPQAVQRAEPPAALTDFELTDQEGRARSLSSFRGQPLLVFFGFAHCPDVCPAILTTLKRAHASKDAAMRRVRIAMISVDGERDSPSAMKAYLAPLSKDFIGLTGEPKKVLAIAREFQAIFFKGAPLNAAGDYNVQHTSQIYLIDADGRLRATLFDPPAEDVVREARAVASGKH